MKIPQILFTIATIFVLASGEVSSSESKTEKWLVLESVRTEYTHILSVRPSMPSKAVRLRFPIEVTLTWNYEENETGLPASETEMKQIYAFEQSLRDRDPNEQLFLQAIRDTGEGKRTWTFYTSSEAAFIQFLGTERNLNPVFRKDPKWSLLSKILAGVRK